MWKRVATYIGIAAVALALGTCNLWPFGSRQIEFADLSGAEALAIYAAPENGSGEDEVNSELYKQLADGTWFTVEYQDRNGRTVDYDKDLLHLQRLNAKWIALVYGWLENSTEGWTTQSSESWVDTFLIDSASGKLYYLNEIADAGLRSALAMSIDPPTQAFHVDSGGYVYYIARPSSYNSFTNDGQELRDHSGVVRLSLTGDNSSSLTGEFITADTADVYGLAVTDAGDMIYGLKSSSFSSSLVYRTASGDVGFVSDLMTFDDTTAELINGGNGAIYLAASESSSSDLLIHSVTFAEGGPTISALGTLAAETMEGRPQLRRTLVDGMSITFVFDDRVVELAYDGPIETIMFPQKIWAGRTVRKSERYVYILNTGDGMSGADTTVFAVLVDTEANSAIEYPLDQERYDVEAFRDYPSSSDAVYAELTDVLTGTRSSYALHPDGSKELLSEEEEETLVVTIEPLN